MPIVINTTLTFNIITQETSKPKFYHWSIKNNKVTSILTALACFDIKALNILRSNFAGFSFFRAPFSDSTKSKIFWGIFMNIFIEDIPQTIIQVGISSEKILNEEKVF